MHDHSHNSPAASAAASALLIASSQNAFKSYVRTRDYCTSPKHIMTMCLNAVRVAVEMGNFMHVTNYVSKAEQTPGAKVGGACSVPYACESNPALSLQYQMTYAYVCKCVFCKCVCVDVLQASACSCQKGMRWYLKRAVR